ncbi:hypothetical protein [Natranaerofaba carboxydovora]|uniref:hypothetical protein n=1 Tax=Natranaerofaba carboxydovora TaxID=2742683 RepID=UPI001F130315|nr:hypothetical protein [Natranaerofaba carboxydovora]UMZ72531.1 Tetratricopeptide repeat protein [Natranaerofaba carboxydovora]
MNQRGEILLQQNYTEKAIEFFLKAKKELEKSNDKEKRIPMSEIDQNLARALGDVDRTDVALTLLNECADVIKGRELDELIYYYNYADIFYRDGDLPNAEDSIKNAIKTCDQDKEEFKLIFALVCRKYAEILVAKNDFDAALKYSNKAVKHLRELVEEGKPDQIKLAFGLSQQGLIYYELAYYEEYFNYEKAQEALNKFEKAFEIINSFDLSTLTFTDRMVIASYSYYKGVLYAELSRKEGSEYYINCFLNDFKRAIDIYSEMVIEEASTAKEIIEELKLILLELWNLNKNKEVFFDNVLNIYENIIYILENLKEKKLLKNELILAETYSQLAVELSMHGDPNLGKSYIDKSVENLKETDENQGLSNRLELAKTLADRANIAKEIDFEQHKKKIIEDYEEAHNIFNEHSLSDSIDLLSKANVLWEKGKFYATLSLNNYKYDDEALRDINESAKIKDRLIKEGIVEKKNMVTDFLNIGNIIFDLGFKKRQENYLYKAINYYKKALQYKNDIIQSKDNDPIGFSYIHVKLGEIHNLLGEVNDAYKQFSEVISLNENKKDENGRDKLLIEAYHGRGLTKYEKRDFNGALGDFEALIKTLKFSNCSELKTQFSSSDKFQNLIIVINEILERTLEENVRQKAIESLREILDL